MSQPQLGFLFTVTTCNSDDADRVATMPVPAFLLFGNAV
jgi:hypothetical protein